MSTSVTQQEHQLEIAEHNNAWRPVYTNEYSIPCLFAAATLARQGNIEHALSEAQEAWIAVHSHMHGVAFRVVTKTETFHAIGNYESCIKTPWQLQRGDDDPLPAQPSSIEQMRDALNIPPNPNVNPPAPRGRKPPAPPAPPRRNHSPF